MGTNNSINKHIIFFDGICNLCNSFLQFIIKRDKKERFFFVSLQSKYAQENLSKKWTEATNFQSIILKENYYLRTKSTAVLLIAKHLSGMWPLLYYLFILIPKGARDFVYDIVAKNRYRWFGKKNVCQIPSPK